MSTATYDRPPLYAVPNPPTHQARLGLLLAIRRRARQAFDALLALPRGAAGWVLRHVRTLLDEIGEHHVLSWAAARVRNAAGLVRGLGVLPVAAAVLSTPPIWRATVRLAKVAGSALASFGRGLWARVKDLLDSSGATGARIVQSLSHTGAAMAGAVRAVLAHPATQPILQTVRSLLGFVRPLSQGVVTHRLIGLLVPAVWLRVALELIVLPLLLAPGMPAAIWSGLADKGPMPPASSRSDGAKPTEPVVELEPDNHPEADVFPDQGEQRAMQPRNRAERRAQQQEQARAKRARAHQ